ncbi:MAG: AI-2E family transporter [Candidatus Melainabacteria bacterium]
MTPSLLSNTARVNLILICVLLLLAAVLITAKFLGQILILLGCTLIITYLLLAPVNRLEHLLSKRLFSRSRRRLLSVITVYITFLMLVGLGITSLMPPFVRQVKAFTHEAPHYMATAQQWIGQYSESTLALFQIPRQTVKPDAISTPVIVKKVLDSVQKLPDAPPGEPAVNPAFVSLLNLGSATVTTLIYALTSLVLVFYLLLDGPILKAGLLNLVPARRRDYVTDYVQTIHRVLSDFIKAQIILAIGAGFYLYVILFIFDVRFAVFLAVFYALASVIPLVGPWAGMLPVTAVLLFSHPERLIPVFVAASIFYLLKLYWVVPQLFNRQLVIHPIVIIFSLLVCIQLADLPGLLLGFPLAALICGTYHYLVEKS